MLEVYAQGKTFVKHLMGVTAENVARRYEISRTRQGEFVVASKQKAEAAAPGLR